MIEHGHHLGRNGGVTPLLTVGHGALAADEFAALALDAGIRAVVDVRRFPGSRRHPHFDATAMAVWLGRREVDYRWIPALGGRRRPSADSPNVSLRNDQFRAYADHMASEEFRAGVGELLDLAAAGPVAVMCAESVWWRCHRRLLADHLVLVRQVAVEHLFHDRRVVGHPPTAGARNAGDHVVYDVEP
ncbi:MAG: DUF488 domain-containing protein [Actinomycetota bacterium]|nr:DUF488 domain-containing protein [Actinomycetota bacterium]